MQCGRYLIKTVQLVILIKTFKVPLLGLFQSTLDLGAVILLIYIYYIYIYIFIYIYIYNQNIYIYI